MDIFFEIGNQSAPKGHAILYFWGTNEPAELYATYIIILPVELDLIKYMPPFLANQIPAAADQDASAFAIPPVPEKMESYEQIEHIARSRRDDLIFGGTLDASQLNNMIHLVNDIVQTYSKGYRENMSKTIGDINTNNPQLQNEKSSRVNDVLYELMSTQDKLTELTKLIGMLKFAIDGNDNFQINEIQDEITMLARRLPESYHINELVEIIKDPTMHNTGLAELYMERCYKLSTEDYLLVEEIENKIRNIQAQSQ
ncbi:MAG: hypothetical protein CL785_05565 [Chloroflexi bacterium]|nr:hypothetical protein [Chloroflexota bacterium]|tara:strand:- start:21377 stop:22144 length:768 start_codon:yes stop_codon:yes gene_type:complete